MGCGRTFNATENSTLVRKDWVVSGVMIGIHHEATTRTIPNGCLPEDAFLNPDQVDDDRASSKLTSSMTIPQQLNKLKTPDYACISLMTQATVE